MAENEDDLGTFKIGDRRRPEVRSFQRPGTKKADPEPAASVGFPSIEQRLESGTIDDVAEELSPSYEKLDGLTKDPKQKASAKKAMIAYERCADLMEYLFATKEALKNPTPSE